MSNSPIDGVPLNIAHSFSSGSGPSESFNSDPAAQSSSSDEGRRGLQPEVGPEPCPRRSSFGPSTSEECFLQDPLLELYPNEFLETEPFQRHCHAQNPYCPPPKRYENLWASAPASSSDDGSQGSFQLSSQQVNPSGPVLPAHDLLQSTAANWDGSMLQENLVYVETSMQVQDPSKETESQALYQSTHGQGNQYPSLPPASTPNYGQEYQLSMEEPQGSALLSSFGLPGNQVNGIPFPRTGPSNSDHNPNRYSGCREPWGVQQITGMNGSWNPADFHDPVAHAETTPGWPPSDVPQDVLTDRARQSSAGPRGMDIQQGQGTQKPPPVPIAPARKLSSPCPPTSPESKKRRRRHLTKEGREHAKKVRAVGACRECRNKKVKCGHVLNKPIPPHTNPTAQSAQGSASVDPSWREGQTVHSNPESTPLSDPTSQRGTTDAGSMDVQHNSDEMALRESLSLEEGHTSPFPMADTPTTSPSPEIDIPIQEDNKQLLVRGRYRHVPRPLFNVDLP